MSIRYEMTADGVPVDEATVKFVAGNGEILQGLEDQLMGLKPGDEKAVTLPPEKGFGAYDPGKVQSLPIEKFGDQAKLLKPGATVDGMLGGKAASARVVSVDNRNAVLDFNHPRAGKTLAFKVKIVDVVSR